MSIEHTDHLTPAARAALDRGDVAGLLALSAARYGGWTMEDTGGDQGGDQGGNGDPAGGGDQGQGGDQSGKGGDQAGAGKADQGDQGNGEDADQARADAAAAREAQTAAETERDETRQLLDNLRRALDPDAGDSDGEADPAELTGQVQSLTTEVAQLRSELLVHQLAGEAGGDPNALLDSRKFATALHKLDPAADDYADQVQTAITDAVRATPSLAASTGGPSRGGADGAGAGGQDPAGSVTPEQFARMTFRERNQLHSSNPTLYRRLAGSGS